MRNIYADNSATTAIAPSVLEKMMPYLTEVYGNPSSLYRIGGKAKEAVEMGFYIGFTGVLAFKNAKKALRALENVPMDRLLLETDCPYMAPPPYRGQRCESPMIQQVAKVVAEQKGLTPQQVCDMTCENAKRLYGIDTQ